jgi:hypothetical protein
MKSIPQRSLSFAAAAAAAALVLSGCGGGDDDPAPVVVVPPATATVSGVVLDGTLAGATVCLDLNDNRACDAGEPSTTTDANGKYTLTAVATDISLKAVLAVAVPTTTTDSDYGPVGAGFTLAAPAGRGAVISPYTTLLLSAVDSGRAANLVQAESDLLDKMVGTAGDVGGLTVYSDYRPNAAEDTTAALVARRARMYTTAQLLTRGFQDTMAIAGLSPPDAFSALGLVAVGSLQQVLGQSGTALTLANRNTIYAAVKDSIVPTQAALDAVATAKAKNAAAPIEGAWLRVTGAGASMVRELYLFAGDGTYVYQVITTGQPATVTQFDAGFGYRYGRYALVGSTLTTTVLEASAAGGPTTTPQTATISGDSMTLGAATLTRVTGTDALIGGYVRPNGSDRPEYLVLFGDGTYVHSTFYYENDPETATASFFETARTAGMRQGTWARGGPGNVGTPSDPGNTNPNVLDFGQNTTVSFNGSLAIPSSPGVASVQSDGSISATNLRIVKLGTAPGAQAVTGFSEATRSRLWSGRYFSRTVSVAGVNRTQYVYVRGPNDVLTFLQAPTGSDVTLACPTAGAIVDFTTVAPTDGKLKQFVIGTGTAASAGYAQRRLNVGQPGAVNLATYTPITRPSNATARCALPL